MLMESRLAEQVTHEAMGTIMSHKAYGLHAEECLGAVVAEIERIEGLLSRFIPDSDISRVNASAGVRSETVSLDTLAVLERAVEFSRACSGCFDVTISPLVALWKIGRGGQSQPDPDSIRRALALVDYRDLRLDPWQCTAWLQRAGQSVDLGGIGKGFAGDRIMEVYREYGITSAYSNLGGHVVTMGTRPDGPRWRVGIQHPRDEERILSTVVVAGQCVVTSGDYQRCFIDPSGKRRHHILDPRRGCPADAGLISVTIVANSSLDADALSTMVFAAGLEQGLELLGSFPGKEAILVDKELRIYITSGLKHRFLADEDLEVTILKGKEG